MISRRQLMAGTAVLALSSCGPRLLRYSGPEVTRIVVNKGQRKMYLLNGQEVLRSYDVQLGFAPAGHKNFEGDGKTPEGSYHIDRKNPDSRYHLSLGISYPNDADREFAKASGRETGGDIFIHGRDNKLSRRGGDWTAGCISVTNREVEEIYSMVRPGTQIDLFP